MNERPVTGSCEQCGRTYALLIPGPGSGGPQLQRVRNAFGWCINCRQFVGRACCRGAGRRCIQCEQANPAAEPDREAGGFAALAAARAAIRHLDGAAAEFSKVEDMLDAVGSADAAAAIGAWDDAWLAAGTLDTRLDSMREATVALLGALPSDEAERALELEQELGAVMESHSARWRSIIDRLVEAGRRLPASPAPETLLPAPPASPSPGPTLAPTSASAVAVAVPLPIHVPDRVTISVTSERRTHSAAAAVPAAAAALSAKAPIVVRTKGGPSSPQQTAVAPRVPEIRPGKALVAAAPPVAATAVPAPADSVASGQGRPAAGGPRVSSAGSGARRRITAVAALAVVVGLAAAGGMLAASIGQLGRDVGSGGTTDADPLGGAGGGPSASAATRTATVSPSAPGDQLGSATAPPLLVTFDLHPVGPVDPVELPVARIMGTPEVVPFPTPFNRSLRLTGAGAGVCLELPAPETTGASSMAFDIHLAEVASDGMLLVVVLAADDAAGAIPLAVDLTAARELDRDAWYRFEVTSTGDSGQLVVTPVGGDQAILEAALTADPATSPTSTDQACIQSALPDAESLYVDNLRVER